MIAKSAAEYFLIRLFPAVGGVLQITLLLKGLGISGYGEWAELFAAAALVNALMLQWIPKAISRYGDVGQEGGALVLRQLMTVQLLVSCIVVIVLICVAAFLKISAPLGIALIAVGESFREAVLEAARATFRKKRYAAITISSTIYGLVLGGMAYANLIDARGVAIAWGGGLILASLAYIGGKSSLAAVPLDTMLAYMKFGVPISFSGALGQFAFSGTRLFISTFYGKEVLGAFSAAYDLLQRLLVSYMQVVNSASFPLIRRAWDDDNIYLVNKLARSNFFLLAFPTFVVVGGVVILWPILTRLLGGNVSSHWMAFFIGTGVIFNRLKTFHVDYFSMLSGRTKALVGNSVVSMGLLAILFFIFGVDGGIEVVTASVTLSYLAGLSLAVIREFLNEKRIRVITFKDILVCISPLLISLTGTHFIGGFNPYWGVSIYFAGIICFMLLLFAVKYEPVSTLFSKK